MDRSGQLHAPVDLVLGKEPGVLIGLEAPRAQIWSGFREKVKNFLPRREWNPYSLVVNHIA
jgi:hypothetical protein